MDAPLVSVIVPCRNEARRIGPAIASLLAGDYPADRVELIVVDGASEDESPRIVREIALRDARVRLLHNPLRTVPRSLNAGVRASSGEIVLRADAHALYPRGYIATLVAALLDTGADNAGCAIETTPGADGVIPRSIARALAHPFGVGDSRFRLGTAESVEVDTVPFGCYRREVFTRIGLFDESLSNNQDDEFNWRLRRAGGRILLVPGMRVRYFARSTLGGLWRMAYGYGRFKPAVLRKTGRAYASRAFAPPALIAALALAAAFPITCKAWTLAPAALYTAANLTAAARSGRDGLRGRLALAAAFACLHVAYGVGFLLGLVAPLPATVPVVRDMHA